MTRVIVVLAVATLAGCAPRPYVLECVGPGTELTPAECEIVADLAVAELLVRKVGEFPTVAVERLNCTEQLTSAPQRPELADAAADACWRVLLDYAGAELTRIVLRTDDGTFLVVP